MSGSVSADPYCCDELNGSFFCTKSESFARILLDGLVELKRGCYMRKCCVAVVDAVGDGEDGGEEGDGGGAGVLEGIDDGVDGAY